MDRAEQRRARKAVATVDVVLPEAPFEGTVAGELPERLPVSPSKGDQNRRRLRGVNIALPTTVEDSPGPDVLQLAVRHLPGGRAAFIEFVKLAAMNGDAGAEAFWLVYCELPARLQSHVKFDDVCYKAGIKPSQLIAAAVQHGVDAATDVGNLIAAALHPAVIAAAGKSATRIAGAHADISAKDRTQFLQGRGFLPAPKGSSLNVNVNQNAAANAQAAAAAQNDPSVPKFGDDIEVLRIPRTTVQRQLVEAAIDADPVGE